MNIALIGYRGSGKTSIGRKLADRLWSTFLDLDDLIVRHAGKPIRVIFEEHGEGHFRELETQLLADCLKLEDHVLALGGGVIEREQNRVLLKNAGCKTIYLRCDPAVLHHRIESDPGTADNRPNLTAQGGLEEVRQKLAQREPLYREAMQAELDVTNLTIDEAVIYVVRLL